MMPAPAMAIRTVATMTSTSVLADSDFRWTWTATGMFLVTSPFTSLAKTSPVFIISANSTQRCTSSANSAYARDGEQVPCQGFSRGMSVEIPIPEGETFPGMRQSVLFVDETDFGWDKAI